MQEAAKNSTIGDFLVGVFCGTLAGILTAVIVIVIAGDFSTSGLVPAWTLEQSLSWVWRNLGLALPVFAIVLGLYIRSLNVLQRALRSMQPIDAVAHAEHLTDTWTSLFFGVGVIWTAIGMRGALLYALGDAAGSIDTGAVAVLQRMVNGGILVALSTTIFGGIGGYLMRVFKTLAVGRALKRYYEQTNERAGNEMQGTLRAIEEHLASMAGQTTEDSSDGPSSVAEATFPRRL